MTDTTNARHDVNEAVTETQKDTMYHHATRHQKHQSLHNHDRLYQRVATSTNTEPLWHRHHRHPDFEPESTEDENPKSSIPSTRRLNSNEAVGDSN